MEPATRLVTLTGPRSRQDSPGTRARALDRGRGCDTSLLVPLAAVRDPAFVALGIAEAIGLSDVTAPRSANTRTRRMRRSRHAAGARQLRAHTRGRPLAADLLASIPSLKLLVTSRAPLRVRGEREYAVGPLPLDLESTTIERGPADLARVPAVRLFLERVRDVQSDFRLTLENSAIVTAICRRLDALPLALELAAPWIKVLTVEDLLRRLERDVLLSPVGARDLPERQQTMSATIAWSYQLLGADEQRTFPARRAARAVSNRSAAAVLGRDGAASTSSDALAIVAGLIDKSLLLRADTSVASRPLYQMLETVRAYGAVELTAAGERDDALDGLVRCAPVKRRAPEQAWPGLRRPSGSTACATIWRTTAPPWDG